jgi:hypothetical protein
VSSGLYERLVADGLLLPHLEADPSIAPEPGAYKVLHPRQLGFISYPYEWCFSQLKDAALATLKLQEIALEHGMSLRDASAYNIQFSDGRPVLIDSLSFELRRSETPWVAYRQFCQHFLAPLALMSYRDARLGQLSRVHLDGVPLDLAHELLPHRSYLRPSIALHIHAHARAQSRGARRSAKARPARLTDQGLRGLVSTLRSAVVGLELRERSRWASYYADRESYSDEAAKDKQRIVRELIALAAPRSTWDLGTNTGEYAKIAASEGSSVVALDSDHASIEAAYVALRSAGERSILPLVADLTNPSPPIGWANDERRSLTDRGPADLVMALALVHHLAIGSNVPLERVAAFFRTLSPQLIVEFVPKTDPMVTEMLAFREDVFPGYSQEGFESAFAGSFRIERREEIVGSDRLLYLMRAHG